MGSLFATEIAACVRCPRLVKYRALVQPARRFERYSYWRRPVAGFGDLRAKLLIVGLAPSAHGGNRTGRVFTGDESGRFLFSALYRAGLSSSPTSEKRGDGLTLKGVYITAIVKCAPPANRPSAVEAETCMDSFLRREMEALRPRAILALGGFAYRWTISALAGEGVDTSSAGRFGHGEAYRLGHDGPWVICSYHPSPRNTYTRTLTDDMFLSVLLMAHELSVRVG